MTGPIVVSDMDGTLSTAETWRGVHAWILANRPSPAARRFVMMHLPQVLLARWGIVDRERFRARWQVDHARLLRGVPVAQLAEFGEWVVTEFLWPARRQAAVDALARAVQEARRTDPAARVILATGAYQPIGDAFGRRVGADHSLGTPLEVRNGLATGELAAPVQSGVQKAAAVRALADGSPVLVAFGDTAADIPLLELARRAIAVAPDATLRQAAIDRGWEIVEGI
jgi:phosphoserine phosphatase